jgi:hypothetical protein
MTMLTSEQVRAGRALIRWEQQDLARDSGLALQTVKRLETIPGPLAAREATITAIQGAFERAGVEFVRGGVKLRTRK